MTETVSPTAAIPAVSPSQESLTDMPSTSNGIVPGMTPVHESIPPALESSTVTIKQEHPSRPISRKRVFRPTLAQGDFVVVKIHKLVVTGTAKETGA